MNSTTIIRIAKLRVMFAKHADDPSGGIYEECPGRGQSSELYLRRAVVFYFVLFDGEKKRQTPESQLNTFVS